MDTDGLNSAILEATVKEQRELLSAVAKLHGEIEAIWAQMRYIGFAQSEKKELAELVVRVDRNEQRYVQEIAKFSDFDRSLKDLKAEIDKGSSDMYRLGGQSESMRAEITKDHVKVDHLDKRLKEMEVAIYTTHQDHSKLYTNHQDHSKLHGMHATKFDTVERSVQDLRAEMDKAILEVQRLGERVESVRDEIPKDHVKKDHLDKRLRETEAAIFTNQQDQSKLHGSHAKKFDTVDRSLKDLKVEIDKGTSDMYRLGGQVESVRAEIPKDTIKMEFLDKRLKEVEDAIYTTHQDLDRSKLHGTYATKFDTMDRSLQDLKTEMLKENVQRIDPLAHKLREMESRMAKFAEADRSFKELRVEIDKADSAAEKNTERLGVAEAEFLNKLNAESEQRAFQINDLHQRLSQSIGELRGTYDLYREDMKMREITLKDHANQLADHGRRLDDHVKTDQLDERLRDVDAAIFKNQEDHSKLQGLHATKFDSVDHSLQELRVEIDKGNTAADKSTERLSVAEAEFLNKLSAESEQRALQVNDLHQRLNEVNTEEKFVDVQKDLKELSAMVAAQASERSALMSRHDSIVLLEKDHTARLADHGQRHEDYAVQLGDLRKRHEDHAVQLANYGRRQEDCMREIQEERTFNAEKIVDVRREIADKVVAQAAEQNAELKADLNSQRDSIIKLEKEMYRNCADIRDFANTGLQGLDKKVGSHDRSVLTELVTELNLEKKERIDADAQQREDFVKAMRELNTEKKERIEADSQQRQDFVKAMRDWHERRWAHDDSPLPDQVDEGTRSLEDKPPTNSNSANRTKKSWASSLWK